MYKIKLENKYLIVGSLILLIFLSYSNSFRASWHLDDFPNIVLNNKIHLEKIDIESISQTFYASPAGKFYRPLPMLSFSLNWYFHGADVFGYHVVNISIHCISSIFLYLCMLELLNLPVFTNRFSNHQIHLISLAATCLWALNPVQTQAITYIVQRMAIMAAMFALVSLYCYLQFRRSADFLKKLGLVVLSVTFYLLATLSKENVVLLPFSILLLELIFFESIKRMDIERRWAFFIVLIAGILGLLLVICFFFDWQNPLDKIAAIYDQRSFTPMQRLMTQSRVLVYYLTLLLLPLPQRLSLCHDVAISSSLFSPLATLASIAILSSLIIYCLLRYKTNRIFSFSILFFFANHIVESTLLPLELVFEHRNYLPSFFIFLPLAVFIVEKKALLSNKNSKANTWVMAGIGLVIFLFGNWTFARNLVWSDEKTFWEYEILKNPALARPYHNLAWGHYQANGDYEQAMALYKKALTLKANSKIERARTLNNLGRIYYLLEDYERALDAFDSVITAGDNMYLAEYQKAMVLIQLERWQQASDLIDHLVAIDYKYLDLNRLKGIIRMHQGETAAAVRFFKMSLNHYQTSVDTLVHLSIALAKMSFYDQAAELLVPAGASTDIRHPLVLMGLADISRLKGDKTAMQNFLDQYFAGGDSSERINLLEKWNRDKTKPLIDYKHYVKRLAKN